MTLSSKLSQRVREAMLHGKWIANTNFKEQIQMVSWQQAIHKIGSLNTIAMLTYHVNYYLEGLIQVYNGGELTIKDKYSFDLPEITNEQDWNNLVERFLANAELFAVKVEQMSEETLNRPFINEKYGTNARNIEAVVEHSYYHLGQISLLRKMITENTQLL